MSQLPIYFWAEQEGQQNNFNHRWTKIRTENGSVQFLYLY